MPLIKYQDTNTKADHLLKLWRYYLANEALMGKSQKDRPFWNTVKSLITFCVCYLSICRCLWERECNFAWFGGFELEQASAKVACVHFFPSDAEKRLLEGSDLQWDWMVASKSEQLRSQAWAATLIEVEGCPFPLPTLSRYVLREQYGCYLASWLGAMQMWYTFFTSKWP